MCRSMKPSTGLAGNSAKSEWLSGHSIIGILGAHDFRPNSKFPEFQISPHFIFAIATLIVPHCDLLKVLCQHLGGTNNLSRLSHPFGSDAELGCCHSVHSGHPAAGVGGGSAPAIHELPEADRKIALSATFGPRSGPNVHASASDSSVSITSFCSMKFELNCYCDLPSPTCSQRTPSPVPSPRNVRTFGVR